MDHKIYLTDSGIYKKKIKYYFFKNNKEITDSNELLRLNNLKVPPGWNNVWYASNKRCHVLVHGTDAGGKKQYILNEKWINSKRSEKYFRMKQFIHDLNSFKKKVVISESVNNKEQLIKLLFNLLLSTNIRVGNEKYAVKNKTYGLTTLKQKHLIKQGDEYFLSFVGKSSISHKIKIPGEFVSIIKQLITSNKNDPLFYYLHSNKKETISSEELNCYLKDNMGQDYTCKDFRTYSANILFIKSFLSQSKQLTNGNGNLNNSTIKKIILKSIDNSAENLGHSRSICKKSYISNTLLDYCIDNFETAKKLSLNELISKI
jgi:DNA topoisomerase-1